MSTQPAFEWVPLNKGCCAINDRGKTVATISSHGVIDWLLTSPEQPGARVEHIDQQTHTVYLSGFKIELFWPSPRTKIRDVSHRIENGGSVLVVRGDCESDDGALKSATTLTLSIDPITGRYLWRGETRLINAGAREHLHKHVEYTNLVPANTGLCFLFEPQKKYAATLMQAADGKVWRFPHQHSLHYGKKIEALRFSAPCVAGFFGEADKNYAITVEESSDEPFFGICDMAYDLHCMLRPARPLKPGEEYRARFRIEQFDAQRSAQVTHNCQPIPITAEDKAWHHAARLALGQNRFNAPVNIAGVDDASAFRPKPPQFVWELDGGRGASGALRIRSDSAGEAVWSAQPPSIVPQCSRLSMSAWVRTVDARGAGMSLRIRYFRADHDTNGTEWHEVLRSRPVRGTTADWVRISIPEHRCPNAHPDYYLYVDVILDGKGAGYLTDLDVSIVQD